MRILFAGTPLIAVPSLERIASEFNVCGVLTNPDRVQGRGKKISSPPVKIKAIELGIPVFQFETLNADAREVIDRLHPEIMVVFAYGKIFGPHFLSIFKFGGVNIHPSLLPKYRGSSPILTAILNGDSQTGITVQKVALKMDTGDILSQMIIPLTGKETTLSLTNYVSEKSPNLIVDVLHRISNGDINSVPQDESSASYCLKVKKSDGLIRWNEEVSVIERKIRAFNPWPGSYTFLGNMRLSIIEAEVFESHAFQSAIPGKVLGVDKNHGILIQTIDGILAVRTLQLQAKRAMDWKTFLNGMPKIIGSVLGGSE